MKRSIAAAIVLVLASACTGETKRCPTVEADCPGGRGTRRPSPSTSPVHHRGGTLDFGVVGSPATLDPYSPLASQLTYELAVPVYASLFRFDPRGRARPYLARSLRRVKGGAEVTLRRAQWSSGRPVSASDVVRTWRRARAPSGFAAIRGATASGPRKIRFQGRVGDWARTLATVAYVLPGGRARRLSAGPFKIRSYIPGRSLLYEKNPKWWGRPSLRSFKVDFVSNLQVLLLLLQKGRLDAAAPTSSVNLDARLASLGLDHSDALGWESIQLRFVGHALNRAERESLLAAVDREHLAAAFIRDEGRVTNTLHPGPGPGGAAGPWSQRLRSGMRIHRRVTLSAPDGDELLGLLQRALQIELAGTVPDLELVTVDPQTFYGRWRHHNPTDVALMRVPSAPGRSGGDGTAHRRGSALPLFEVESVVAWRPGVAGMRANPTFDGPLWNVALWSRL